MTVNVSNATDLQGLTVLTSDGDKLGRVEEVYLDNRTGEPDWVSVKTGFFGGNTALIPLAAADLSADTISVPYSKSQVKNAPHNDPGQEISEADERDLFSYYGITYGDQASAIGPDAGRDRADTRQAGDVREGLHEGARADAAADNGQTVTRSEERLHVGTEQVESGRARLRKYITTETATRTVPVSHEELVVEREPITDANVGDALSGRDLTEDEHQIILHEERPVVVTETVPVERIKLGTRTVTEEATVSEEIRKENIELDGVEDAARETRR